jgi:prepilin-type N-terminal cleavage/methylation domain-containing protein
LRVVREDGFTLVELVVSLTVLAVGIGSVVNVFNSSFSVAAQGNNRSRAVAMATRDAEAMRAVPYERLGFNAVQSGFVTVFEGAATVVVGDPVVQPAGPDQVIGGMTFSFVRHVVWAAAASTAGYPQAYKRVVVLVSWIDRGGTHVVRQDAFVYPGGQGVYTGPAGSVTTTTLVAADIPPSPPLTLTASVPSDSTGASTVNLAWTASPVSTPAVAAWVVQFSTDLFVTAHLLTDTQPASVLSFAATGLSPSTSYQFRVAARSSSGAQSTWSVTAAAATSAMAVASCSLGTATITPSAVLRLHGATTLLVSNAAVSVNASGSCSSLQLKYSATAGTTTTAFLISAGGGGVWTGVLNGLTASWDTGTHQVQVVDGTGSVLGTLTFTVCVHNAKSCP